MGVNGAADGSVIIDSKIDNSQFRKGLVDMTRSADAWPKSTQEDFKAVTASCFNMVDAVKSAVAAFAGFKVVGMGKDALMAAARYETLGITLNQVGKNIGKLPMQMKDYEDALQKTGIAALEARSSIIQLATANLDLERSAELARVAQDLAVVSGLSSAESFERMTHGIINGQSVILPYLHSYAGVLNYLSLWTDGSNLKMHSANISRNDYTFYVIVQYTCTNR